MASCSIKASGVFIHVLTMFPCSMSPPWLTAAYLSTLALGAGSSEHLGDLEDKSVDMRTTLVHYIRCLEKSYDTDPQANSLAAELHWEWGSERASSSADGHGRVVPF